MAAISISSTRVRIPSNVSQLLGSASQLNGGSAAPLLLDVNKFWACRVPDVMPCFVPASVCSPPMLWVLGSASWLVDGTRTCLAVCRPLVGYAVVCAHRI
jgi:hypothetical protein